MIRGNQRRARYVYCVAILDVNRIRKIMLHCLVRSVRPVLPYLDMSNMPRHGVCTLFCLMLLMYVSPDQTNAHTQASDNVNSGLGYELNGLRFFHKSQLKLIQAPREGTPKPGISPFPL